METTEMAVVVGMQENVSSKMPAVTNELQKTKAATQELASGVMYMGSMFVSASIAMERSNNEALKSTGNMLAMVGGIITAVGSAAQFVAAASRIANALKLVNLQLIVQKALSGPMGWAMLAGAVAAGGLAAYKLSNTGASKTAAAVSSDSSTFSTRATNNSSSSKQVINLNVPVQVDGKQLGQAAKKQLILDQHRNYKSGVQ